MIRQRELRRHDGTGGHDATHRLVFSADGRMYAANRWRKVVLWETSTGLERLGVESDGRWPFISIAISPDNRILAGVKVIGDKLSMWETGTGQLLSTVSVGSTSAIAFSPHEWKLATAGTDSLLRIWNLTTLLPKKPTLGGKIKEGEKRDRVEWH
jgi:WD40 repeat protein